MVPEAVNPLVVVCGAMVVVCLALALPNPGIRLRRRDSPSLQIVSPALNRTLDSSGNFRNMDTAYLLGVRVGIRF